MAQEPFGDIPLFREIQRLLASGGGPINLEIARQVGNAIATQGSQDPDQKPEVTRSFAEAVHAAEALVSGYTRMTPAEPILARTVGRGWWVGSTLGAWSWLLERLAGRFTEEMTRAGAEADPSDPMGGALGQVAPLLLGIQAGSLVGHLATETLVRYDLPIPRDDDGQLFLVTTNADQVASDYGLDGTDLRRWLSVHDVARHLVATSVAWVGRYRRALIVDVVDAIEIDLSELQRRLAELQEMGMQSLEGGLGAEPSLPVVQTERHRRALGRLRSFLALFEGYSSSAAAAVMPSLVADATRIDEGMARRRVSSSAGEEMLSAVLGVSLDRALETAGQTFCAAVVEMRGLPALNRVWEAPDNLPTPEEIKDPFAWMERALDE